MKHLDNPRLEDSSGCPEDRLGWRDLFVLVWELREFLLMLLVIYLLLACVPDEAQHLQGG